MRIYFKHLVDIALFEANTLTMQTQAQQASVQSASVHLASAQQASVQSASVHLASAQPASVHLALTQST